MASFLSNDKATTIRMPSVANLMIDTIDRDPNIYPSPFNFQITRQNNLQTGYFTRIAATEVVLEWCEPNVFQDNSGVCIDISGVGANAYANNDLCITLPTNFYNMAQLLDAIVAQFNLLSGTTGATFSIITGGRNVIVDCSGAVFKFNPGVLTTQAELTKDQNLAPFQAVGDCPDLRWYRYLDFVSEQLTYAQDVKDNTTANNNRNVLLRWYMAWDNPPSYDTYGFPVLMGYSEFVCRRMFSPPKYIKWETNLPVGNLAFTVYDEQGGLVEKNDPGNFYDTNWLMTLQLSEN